jgi:hypothetical protein
MDPKDFDRGDTKKKFAYVYAAFKQPYSNWTTPETPFVDDSAANKAAWEETAALLNRVMRK